MSKGLKALKEYRAQQQGVNVYADELLDIVEKELKALEIIKEKRVDINLLLNSVDSEMYNMVFENWNRPKTFQLTQEKFELLREVLL